jgi:TatD DNase family protein
MVVLVDSHCHLDFNTYQDDRMEVLERARKNGLTRVLIPGIDIDSSRQAVELARNYEEVFAAVGVHPNDASDFGADTLSQLRELASKGKSDRLVSAVGEIGLDYYRKRTSPSLQRPALISQLALARELELPVVLHNRDASIDLLPILVEWHAELESVGSPLADRPGVLHSFADTIETALTAMDAGFFIGISGPVTYKSAVQLQETVAELPLESLLIETDGPFLTPHPHRGQRNEPAYVRLVAEKIAAIKNIPLAEVATQTTANAARLFNW